MTVFVKTALCAALAATLSLAIAPTTVAAKSRASHSKITTGSQGQSAGPNNTFCGKGDVFVIYDEDANGNPVPGTERYGCTD
jgi:hypothetical protein